MDSEDGEIYIKNLANYVHSNEKALANANTTTRRGPISRHTPSHSLSSAAAIQRSPTLPARPSTSASSLSFTPGFPLSLGFGSRPCKSTKLSFTPHHLFYLLSRFEELGIDVGPLKIRLENIQDTSNTSNYVSFLSSGQRSKTHGSDIDSIRSVSSIRSVMSSVTTMWSHFGFGGSISAARTERHKAFIHTELKYLYSSFTIIPALRLAPDWRARLVRGYEEFPFDSAVPLHAFKNVQTLDLEDIDFRQFFGWDRMADQLKSLTLRRASIDDPADILIDIVLDDMDGRRRRTAKAQHTPPPTWTDSLHSLTRNPLPAISSLNLRANRLQSLSGIEKLLPLERLDLRENRLTDPVELACLTGIPYIREIWVEGNPFIRTHKDYRITIFNLFRKTPGYTEDLVIDGSGPSYSEKRYLLDRVPVPAAVPVVRQPAPEVYLVDIGLGSTSPTPKPTATCEQQCRPQREPTVLRKDRPTPRPVTNDAHRSPHRRKKGSKRRIVDLSTSEPSRLPPPTMMTNDMAPPPIPSEYLRGSQSQKAPELPSFPQASSQKTPASKASTCAPSSKEALQHDGRKQEACKAAATPATATNFTGAPAIPSARVATVNKPNASRHRHRISQSSDVSQPEPASPPLEAQAQTPKVVPAADSCANTVCPVISPESDISVLYGSGEPDGSEWDMSGELYRRKIEALRSQVGERYLTMLSETALTEGSLADGRWKASPSVEFAADYRPAISTVPPLQPASISKPTVVSGRMIG
ncbi:putative leucine-rich repeat-containing protein [Ceratocystis platani]|uniref:Putative leucine-rich repeat-containing protein n=1 Tax=Ceratocystis fimbriata f. sp. platani TaxID=88771 RepID=A0A0F8DHA1_CERFI|nr:putative leucine-rich repeat-containing protein [Ceratocystis platani]